MRDFRNFDFAFFRKLDFRLDNGKSSCSNQLKSSPGNYQCMITIIQLELSREKVNSLDSRL